MLSPANRRSGSPRGAQIDAGLRKLIRLRRLGLFHGSSEMAPLDAIAADKHSSCTAALREIAPSEEFWPPVEVTGTILSVRSRSKAFVNDATVSW
jgi:hypothetical protein